MLQDTLSYEEWQAGLYHKIMTSICDSASTELARDWFWVIDTCAHSELPDIFWKLDNSSSASPLYMNTYREEELRTGPWLIPCQLNSGASQWIFNQAQQIPLGFLVSTNKGTEDMLFEHFQNLLECSVRYTDGSLKKILYRYYDPRVLYAIGTYCEQTRTVLIKGPARSLHAWDPGRQACINRYYTNDKLTIAPEQHTLTQAFLDTIFEKNKIHTVIGSLGGQTGELLRSKPLSEAYAYVSGIYSIIEDSTFNSVADLGFITAYALSSPDNRWEETLFRIMQDKPAQYTALSEAFTQRTQSDHNHLF